MLYLLIDIGNSFAKYATYEAGALSSVKKVATASLLDEVSSINLSQSEMPQSILLVSVADKVYTKKMIKKLESHFQCSVQHIETQKNNFGVSCGYCDYRLLGDDRWVAILGAFNSFCQSGGSSNLLIIDCGSVVTVDMLTNSGEHLGGWMMPNSHLMVASLGQKSDGIKLGLQDENALEIEKKTQKMDVQIGRSTSECVELGSQLAVKGFIEQCFEQVKRKYSFTPLCVLTGGGAEDIISQLSMRVEYRPNLVFDGLVLFTE